MSLLASLLLFASRPYEGVLEVPAPVEAVAPQTSAPPRSPPPGLDSPSPPREPPRTWVVGAFIDAGYVFNSNLPDNHVNRGIVTAPRTGEITVSYAAAYLRHDASDREPWSLELALQAGPAANALVAAEPQPGGDASRYAGANVWQHLGRANVGARIPRAGTQIAAGVFDTPIGYWSFWPKDNWSYSTPWHLNAVPYVLMGGRIRQPAGERVMLHAWIVNGYQTYADVNKAPSYMLGLTVAATESLLLGHFDYFGPEDVDLAARSWRWLSDTWLFFERGRFGIAGVFDAMRERVTVLPGQPVALQLAGELSSRVRLLEARGGKVKWYVGARGEAFWDRDGRIFGVRQLLGSGLASTDLRLWDYLLVRLEYRYDRTDNQAGFFYRRAAVRDDDAGLGREQHAIYFVLTGMFEHWFAARPKPRR